MKILISISEKQLEIVDQVAKEECRSRSELVREAIRQYLKSSGR